MLLVSLNKGQRTEIIYLFIYLIGVVPHTHSYFNHRDGELKSGRLILDFSRTAAEEACNRSGLELTATALCHCSALASKLASWQAG